MEKTNDNADMLCYNEGEQIFEKEGFNRWRNRQKRRYGLFFYAGLCGEVLGENETERVISSLREICVEG